MDGVTPVTVVFTPEGLTVVSVKGGATYKRVIPWKEMYKLGLRGEKITGSAVVKQISKKVNEMVASNVKSMNSNKKFLKTLKSRPVSLPPPPRAASL